VSSQPLTFEGLNSLSQGKIHEMTYFESELGEWEKGNISQLKNSNAPLFIKNFIEFKKNPESSRCKSPWYFGESYVASKLADFTKKGWYSSFKWLYADKWLKGNTTNRFETIFYKEALTTYIGDKLQKLYNVSNKVTGFPNQPATPDLWLVDNKGQHHFIEVKTWRWNYVKNKWDKDTPKEEQLAGLALIQRFLQGKVYIVLLYPHNNNPFVSWQNHINQFNDFRHKLSHTFIGE